MTLYQLDQEILECIDAETGEVIDFERLEQLSIDRQSKIDNIACWVKQLNAESAAIDTEIHALEVRKKSKERRADSLKQYLAAILDGDKFESARAKIAWRLSDEVNITDGNAVPAKYNRLVTDLKISKSDIKAAIKSGVIVAGAELLYKQNIQIS